MKKILSGFGRFHDKKFQINLNDGNFVQDRFSDRFYLKFDTPKPYDYDHLGVKSVGLALPNVKRKFKFLSQCIIAKQFRVGFDVWWYQTYDTPKKYKNSLFYIHFI